ncbi:MAG: cytidylate kinase-like family protein [Lachnospiraceae bacterium]|nr:cytidylate kinase-like family protein [Lachnospiraceae bacterium]
MKNVVITIARGFGSGGKEIGVILAEELGIPCYEKEILNMASDKSGISKALFEETDEKLKSSFLRKMLGSVPRNYKVEASDRKFTHDNNLFHIQSEVIEELAKTESCIIIGKCADYVLKDKKSVIRVYIDAPMSACIVSIVDRMGVEEMEAIRMINKTNKYRSDYYRYYTGGRKWGDPVYYDICLNSASWGRAKCVSILKQLYEERKAM